MFIFPLASLCVQTLVYALTGMHLRSGDALIQMMTAIVISAFGMLFVVPRALKDFKAKRTASFIKSFAMGFGLSLLLAALELWTHEADRFCGGMAGACGQWQ